MLSLVNRFSVFSVTESAELARQLESSIRQHLPDYAYYTAASPDLSLRTAQNIKQNRENVSLVVLDGGMGYKVLSELVAKLNFQLPESSVIVYANGLPADHLGQLNELSGVHRVYSVDVGSPEFAYSLLESARFQRQEFELREKSLILTELHRASMSLTGETDLGQLLHKLMRIVIDNAEALNAYIILRSGDGELRIEASGSAGHYETNLQPMPLSDFSPVCPGVVEFAVHNLENIILADALNEGLFSSHPYIRKNRCRSLLCSPMVYQGRVLGVLYLENNERTNAFSSASLEFLKLLSATAAIAIQNAQTYSELENRVAERTREVIEQKGEIERQRDEIQLKNNDILSSIRYARRIQRAVLPNEAEMREQIPELFVLYRPKDVVSGDFYWFSQRLSKVILAAADCTGHGVPGAFMTIMANTLLKQIVELEGIFEPGEILQQLDLRIRVALHHAGSNEPDAQQHAQNDGLDIALCQLDVKRMRLHFAGANRSLVMLRNNELVELKPERYGIGGEHLTEEARTYTTHAVAMEAGDTFYMFSDGFADQIGQESQKRYGNKALYKMLQDIQDKDMEHQRLLLDAELEHWRGRLEQTDDVLIMGFRV